MEDRPMSDRHESDLPFESSDTSEQALWAALQGLPEHAPSPELRRGFYRALEEASGTPWWARLGAMLGFGSSRGWLSAAASLALGFGLALSLNGGEGSSDGDRLATLEASVAILNRELILDRLVDANAGTRLKGVFDARTASEDEQIVRALLQRAAQDRVPSVRTAAIEVLSAKLPATGVGDELMQLLDAPQSPTVQLALVDMVLRNGNREELDRLLQRARAGRLHPDIIQYLEASLGSERA